MSHVDHYECDECGVRARRITIHRTTPGRTSPDLHFCGTLCMDQYVMNSVDTDAAVDWWSGQDIRDGA